MPGGVVHRGGSPAAAGGAPGRIAAGTRPAAAYRNALRAARAAAVTVLLLAAAPLGAETLPVGPGQRFARLADAAAIARPGDTVLLSPGQHADCVTWRVPDVTIAAAPGGPAVLEGPACGGKALFVAAAPRLVIDGITFRGARVAAGNGAGIRAEGGDLTIRRSRFEENENGILSGPLPGATFLIEDSVFRRNGAIGPPPVRDCAHGIYAGEIGALVIRRSRFEGTRICHHVKSRAARLEITDSEILDTPDGEASYLVDVPNGGDLLLRGNRLRKGPRTGNAGTAIAIGFEGVRMPPASLRIEANSFENLLPGVTGFVVNRSATPALLVGNQLRGPVEALRGPGEVR